MFKKNYLIGSALAAIVALSSVSYAQYDVSYDRGKLKISGIAAQPGDEVTVTAFPAGTNTKTAASLYAMESGKSNAASGEVSFEFGVNLQHSGAENVGDLIIFIKEDSRAEAEELAAGYPVSKVLNFIKMLQTSTSGEDIKGYLCSDENIQLLKVLSLEEFKNIPTETQKNDVAAIMLKSINGGSLNGERLYSIYIRAFSLSEINAKHNVTAALSELDPEFEGTAYTEIRDNSLKSWIESKIVSESYENESALADKYAKLNILHRINSSDISGMQELIKKYAAALDIDDNSSCKQYIALSGENADRASDSIRSALYRSPAENGEQLAAVIKTAVDGINSGSGGGVTGGGGSGSGGGKGSKGGSSGGGAAGGVTNEFGFTDKTVQGSAEFSDIDGVPWARTAIEVLAKKGILSGTGNGLFDPDSEVTREQFAKMLVAAANIPTDNGVESPFTDVKKIDWSYKYVNAAYKCGIINGVSETEFDGTARITRQDVAVMAKRAADATGTAIKQGAKTVFADADGIAEYARESVGTLSAAGVISGIDGEHFAPNESCTRAQAAKIIYLLFFAQ